MPPFTYRLRVLIPRDLLPPTAAGESHALDLQGHTITVHIKQGAGTRPDALVVTQRGLATAEQARAQAEVTKYALMRAGLVTHVPMNFGRNESSFSISALLVDRTSQESGATMRPDVHGIDVMDEVGGPVVFVQFQAEGTVRRPVDRFLGELATALDRNWHDLASRARLGLAVEVFMAADLEQTPRSRFLGLVTVLEILAERGPRSEAAIAVVEKALAMLEGQRADLGDEERNSLRSALTDLKARSIGRSIGYLAAELEGAQIDGFNETDIGHFLRRCYTLRSLLVHEGVAPLSDDVAQMSGSLIFAIRHLLIRRIDESSSA